MPENRENPRATSDELAIRDLVSRYSDAVNRRDANDWGATWAVDAQWHLFGQTTAGREAIVKLWSTLMQGFPFVLQLVHSGTITLSGDRASGRWYLSEISKRPDGSPGSMVGVYHDAYRCENGEWRFAERRLDVLYMGPPDLSGTPSPFPSDL